MDRKTIILEKGAGRSYDMGALQAIFKADGDESQGQYSISEWWLDPNAEGPGVHTHPEDDIFYVLEGALSVCIDGDWICASKGSFILVPGGTAHDFENRTNERTGFLNFSAPGNFENAMPSIVEWFKAHRS